MNWSPTILVSIAAAVAALMISLVTAAPVDDELQRTRKRFLEAYEAGLDGHTAHADNLAQSLTGYVLYPYLEYAMLKGRLERASDKEVSALLERYPNFAFTSRLKHAWLDELADENSWDMFSKHYDGGGSTTLRCHGLNARLQTGNTDGLAADAIRLWRVGHSQPQACDPVFEWLYEHGHVNDELRFERVALSLEAGNTGLAAYLARPLADKWKQWVERWREMLDSPVATLERAADWPHTEIARRIVKDGLYRVAGFKESGGHAWKLWQQVRKEFDFSDEQRGVITRHLALDAATDYHADSLEMLQAVPKPYVNASVRAWRVRVPLMRRDWPQVLVAIDAMPADQREEKSWRYWRARALEATGKQASAELLYQALARDVSFYGFLAADRIDAPYDLDSRAPDAKPEVQHALMNEPAMQRAFELYQVGLTLSAREEWQQALRDAGREELIQAALLAREQGWHDRVIFALADVALWDAYKARFPLAFEKPIKARAKQHGLDSSWLYGLIRSESLFVADAHSSAGAYGLMQVLPGTGRDMAKKLNVPWNGAYALMEPEYNLTLGSAYLAGLLKRYQGNMMLATAAYNGGPHEVDAWVPDNSPKYAAIWIETIPFYETRAYLKRVFAFSVLYDWRLGGGITRLSERLPGKPGAAKQATPLPTP